MRFFEKFHSLRYSLFLQYVQKLKMDSSGVEEALRVFEASLSQIKWRLKPSSKSRLQTVTAFYRCVLVALCWDVELFYVFSSVKCRLMRPCIMVDYGGKMPELGDRLCAFLSHCKKESSIFELLQVMVIDDMVYLIQVKALADFIKSSLSMETAMLFVDLENDPPKMMTQAVNSPAINQLLSAQKLFSSVFHADRVINNLLESFLQNEINVGQWLLGYPVIYLFGKDYIDHAVCNLSTKSLHIYQIYVNRNNNASSKGCKKEELMSFTVPYELSLEGSNEAWAQLFLGEMMGKWEKCKHVWESLNMEVIGCYPQAIAL
ncbi:hypothetical protein PHJA_001725200 [Phtheirospermum japonicum]|uniref:Uncharacterized protein n=1 Tax=Phtheirospermum japonicum TaxID=374723 RepID=A0A830C8C8_9LAMI|nr:hypothetical protein PHJA_001725200 [Phtheirospermum japonicum]